MGTGAVWRDMHWWRLRVGQVGRRRRVRLPGSAPQLGQGLEFREPYCGGISGGGGGVCIVMGCLGCSWGRIGAKVTSIDGARSSQKRPWKKARTLASNASPGMSRGAPIWRPPMGFLNIISGSAYQTRTYKKIKRGTNHGNKTRRQTRGHPS